MKFFYRLAILFLLCVIAVQIQNLHRSTDHVAEALGWDMGAVQP